MTPIEPPSEDQLRLAQQALGLEFADTALLALALTHRSFVNENPASGALSNERLEFLGDSVINFVVGLMLYQQAPEAPEGELTARRAQIVRREALAQAAKKLSVGTWLVMGRGEAASGGAERVSNLANAFEAVAGAVYLDKGFHAARDFIVRALDEHITALAKSAGAPKDPKSVLQEVLQGRGAKSPEYTLVSMMGPDHDRTFVVEVLVDGHVAGRGEGRRKIDAERAAALDAVSRLDTSGQD